MSEPFLNKVAGLKRLRHMYFPVKFAKCLKTPLFIEHLWLLPRFGTSVFYILRICTKFLKQQVLRITQGEEGGLPPVTAEKTTTKTKKPFKIKSKKQGKIPSLSFSFLR